jgi:hypothetical protein
MPDYLPTITTSATPQVEIRTPGSITYESLQTSIGSYFYKLLKLYQYTSLAQLMTNVYLRQYNPNGNEESMVQVMAVDPYQYQDALDVDTGELNYIMSGQNNLFINVLSGATIYFIFTVEVFKSGDKLPGENNFERLEYFKGYNPFQDTQNRRNITKLVLNVTNNLPIAVNLSLLGGAWDPYGGGVNQHTLYVWNTAGQSYTGLAICQLEYRRAGVIPYSVATMPVPTSFAQLLVNLNNLGLGMFWNGGSDFKIYASNDTWQFRQLSIA